MKKTMKIAALLIFALALGLDIASKHRILLLTGFPVPLYGQYTDHFPEMAFFDTKGRFLNIVLLWNTGISFSMLTGNAGVNSWILVVASLAIMTFLFRFMLKDEYATDAVGFSMILAGAAGNVIDRVRFGAVVDFIDLHYGKHHWPAFNLADTFICLGAALIITRLLFRAKK